MPEVCITFASKEKSSSEAKYWNIVDQIFYNYIFIIVDAHV